MAKKLVNPKWFRHEALHTTNVCTEMVNDHLINHHYYNSAINPEFVKQVNKAMKHLQRAYQAVGNHSNEVTNKIAVDDLESLASEEPMPPMPEPKDSNF